MIEVRERLTERINRARLKLEFRRAMRPMVVVLIGALIGLGFWAYQINEIGQYVLKDSRTLRFAVDDATAVVPKRQEVRFRGIPAGTITEVKMEDGRPVLEVSIFREFGPIYRDARAALRPNTALEDMYLDILDRGTTGAGEATADTPLPARQTDTSVQFEEVLQVFDPGTRGRMSALLSNLGGGLGGRGDELRETFVKVVPFIQALARMSEQLQERSDKTRRLVHDFATLSGELARRERQLRTLAVDGGRTVRSFADASGALDATLRELPPTLGELDSSFGAVRGVLPELDQALRSLGPVAGRLPQALSDLRRLSDSAEPAVHALRTPVRRLVPLARVALPFSADLAEALAAMRPQTGAIEHISRSLAACVYPALYGFFHWDTSLSKFEDARGVFPRGDFSFGLGSNSALSDPHLQPNIACAPGEPKRGEP